MVGFDEIEEICKELKVDEIEETLNLIDLVIDGKKYCLMKDNLDKAMYEIEIWQYAGGGSNFTQKLIELIAKADIHNQKKLLKAFPDVVGAYLIWFNHSFDKKSFDNDKELFEYVHKRLSNRSEIGEQ